MVRKGGATAEFVYGLGISSLQPADQVENNEETPLRFVSVQLQLADSSKSLDVDVHAFLFESDGTYVDCVFYKNPTLAGKSVRLLQQDQELLVDLRYIPQRCSFIVCTLAIYSGGTVAQLGDGSVQLSALVPRLGLEDNADFPHLPCGQIPPGSSEFYEWVCLGMLPLRPRSSLGEECGMMLCLLAHHAGFWYFKPVLKPVTAFTPQGLIEPAQDYVTRHVAGLNEETPGIELGSLIKAAREGTHVQFELEDTEECLAEEAAGDDGLKTPELGIPKGIELDTRNSQGGGFVYKDAFKRHGLLAKGQGDVPGERTIGRRTAPHLQAAPDPPRDEVTASIQAGRRLLTYATTGRKGAYENAQLRDKGVETFDMEKHLDDGGGKRGETTQMDALSTSQFEGRRRARSGKQRDTGASNGGAIHEAVSSKHKGIDDGACRVYRNSRSADKLTGSHGPADGEPLFTSFSPASEREKEPRHRTNDGRDVVGRDDSWRESVERRLSALERSVEGIWCNLQMIAAATCEMQKNNKLYIQELRDRFTELKNDVASDIESALSGPLEALSLRLEEVKDDEGADAKQLAEQQRKLWAVDKMVLLHERNWHLLAQSISELRFQLSGLEQRIEQAVPAIRDSAAPPTDHAKGLPLSLQSSALMNNVERPHDKEAFEAPAATQGAGESSGNH
ncbi:hypothetical protein, conserved [Eimeria brunetti]|uniref:TerD domain-containing protein n=1 Tax=Eimeria brunetti TaxID=51314 RepID=U6LTP8_9EIME|nr:hypothetical protein, conserved [Eimeria brunetti]